MTRLSFWKHFIKVNEFRLVSPSRKERERERATSEKVEEVERESDRDRDGKCKIRFQINDILYNNTGNYYNNK